MNQTLEERLRDKRGIRFFGDVHGNHGAFAAMARDALDRGWRLHSLGDIIDKGPDSPACMRLACDLHDAGELELTPGNHCEKFMRWMQGRPVKLRPHGLGLTVSQLAADRDGKRTAERYFDLVAESALWSRFGDVYAVHAAFHRMMIGRDGPRLQGYSGSGEVRSRALYGEVASRPQRDDELPKRTYGWLDEVPESALVLLGHSVYSLDTPTERRCPSGARVIHLDTGLAIGGTLSWLDIPTDVLLGKSQPLIPRFPEASDLTVAKAA